MWHHMNQVYMGVIQVDIRTTEVQVTLLYLYLESVAEFGVVGIVVYRNA